MDSENLSFGVTIPFIEHLGCRLTRFADGQAEIALQPRPELLNSFAVTHGGVLMTLLDVAMASAARSVCPEMGVVTIELKTSFMRPAMPLADAPLRAQASLLHRTATMAFTQGSVFDAHGHVCAHATATFKYMKRLATGARSVAPLQIPTD